MCLDRQEEGNTIIETTSKEYARSEGIQVLGFNDSVKIQGMLLRTVVRPPMMHGLDTAVVTKKQERQLEVAETRMVTFYGE